MIRIIIALLSVIFLMESCSSKEDSDTAELTKNEVILCRVGNADSASLIQPLQPTRPGVTPDSTIKGDGD